MSESNATELIKYLTEDNLKLMYGRLNRRYVVVDALPSVDSLEPADKNVIYVVKETVDKTVRYWPNVLDNDAWKPFGIDREDLDRKADKVSDATYGNFAALDASGNLADSGFKASDFKPKQTAVTDPTASGSGIEFIDSISQDTNGVIVPVKKSVQVAVASTSGVGGNAGVMSAADKEKLDGIEDGAQANTIESISINNAPLDITHKNVDIPLATADSDGLLPHEKFPLIPAEPVAGANRIYSFDDTNGTSWQTIVKEYVGNMILDQQGTPVTDEKGDIMYEEEAVPLWLSYKGVEFGARRAYDDHTGANIHDSIEARTTMAQVTTAIETALAKYGGFVVVQLTQGADPVPDVQNPSTKLIYLTKDASSTKTDPYTEWIYTADNHWEVIGETSIDLSGKQDALSGMPGMAANKYLQTDANQNIVWGNLPAEKDEVAIYTYGQAATNIYNDYNQEKVIYCKYNSKLVPLIAMGSNCCTFVGVINDESTINYSGPRFVSISLFGTTTWGVEYFKIPTPSSSDVNKVLTIDSNGAPQWQIPSTVPSLPSPTINDSLLLGQADGSETWTALENDVFGTRLPDEETGKPMYDASSTDQLWTGFAGKEFGAARAYADQDGNNIKATYATKEDLNTALGDIESLLAAL